MVRGSVAARRLLCQIGASLAIAVLPAMAQNAVSQVRAEMERLQRSLKEKPVAMPGFAFNAEKELKTISEALDAGGLYTALERLNQVEGVIEGIRFAADRKAEVAKGGMPAFQAVFHQKGRDLAAFEKTLETVDWSPMPAAVRALSDAARTRTGPLLEGGLGFATAIGPADGLFYLGQAEGEARFARFCASLKLPRAGAPFPLRSLLPELDSLQEKTNAAFQPPRSIDQHPRFIALNSTLKLARELDAAKLYAGALYEYLEATRHYGMLDMAPLDDAGKAELKKDLAAAHTELDADTRDHSIAQIFLERADGQIAHADGSTPGADDWRSARAIADRVLPAFFAAQKPAAPLRQVAGKTVDITLVRWPYT